MQQDRSGYEYRAVPRIEEGAGDDDSENGAVVGCSPLCCGTWLCACGFAFALSGAAWVFTVWATRQLAGECSWWPYAVAILLVLVLVFPAIPVAVCLCGSGSFIGRKKAKGLLCGRVVEVICGLLFSVAFVVVVGIACALVYLETGHRIPREIAGLSDEVTIEYDYNDIPHITASTMRDAFLGIGLVHARHRLWEMESERRLGKGTLSEVLGADSLSADMEMRNLGLYLAAQRVLALLSDAEKDALQGYCDGVNAYIDSNPHLPLEFLIFGFKPAHWEPVDSLVIAKVMGFELSTDLDAMITRWQWLIEHNVSYERALQLYPQYNRSAHLTGLALDEMSVPSVGVVEPASETEAPEIINFYNSLRGHKASTYPDAVGAAEANRLLTSTPSVQPYDFEPLRHGPSNNFVVSGKLTGTGPILANDPHLTLSSPGVWFGMRLTIRGLSEAVGVAFPGVPGIVIGHTEHAAWGVTTTAADVQDLYVIDVTADGQGYHYDGQVLPFVTRQEVISIKDKDPYIMTVYLTQDGMPLLTAPLVHPYGPPLALKWPAIDPAVDDLTVLSFYKLLLVANWTDFREALRGFVGPVHNFVFASDNGDIGYLMPGLLPQRSPGHTGLFPVPGNTSAYRWRDYIPFDLLPQSLNPEKGYIVTANNQITPIGYEKPGWNMHGEYLMHYRAQRISDLIEQMAAANHLITVEDLRTIQLDVASTQFQDLLPAIRGMPESALSSVASEWRQKLLVWDGNEVVGSEEATVFNSWVLELQRVDSNELGMTQWGDWSTAWAHILGVFLGEEEDPGCDGDCPLFAAQALNTAVMRFTPGKKWGSDLHRAQFLHPVMSSAPDYVGCIFDRTAEHGGDCNTVNAGCFKDNSEMGMTIGPSYRQIIALSDINGGSKFLVPPGQSGEPLSQHYADMLKPWSAGEYLSMSISDYHTAYRVHVSAAH
eukprot:TRINITY_DN17961_c0_g1_i1.p1 TRINITY_DN17961_c0_g1~~TRINITY_DN17961_c0_g1_i1.p1  ORF type:complete len:939 (-),score=183.12 TRINITY_DN17961_c0_g1_i1:167-2983(-)